MLKRELIKCKGINNDIILVFKEIDYDGKITYKLEVRDIDETKGYYIEYNYTEKSMLKAYNFWVKTLSSY